MDKEIPKFQAAENAKVPIEPEKKKRSSLYDVEEIEGGGFNAVLPGLIDKKREAIVGTSRQRFETREEAEQAIEKSKVDRLLEFIETEDLKEKLGYFDVKEKTDKLSPKEAESIWGEIGRKLKEAGIFNNLEQEGIDIFGAEKDWKFPYPVDFLSEEDIQQRLGSEYKNIGGYYKNGRVAINQRFMSADLAKETITCVASGGGLGDVRTIIHETYHGFQDIAPEEAQKCQAEKSELGDKIKAAELTSKITGKPAYELTNLRYQKEQLEKKRNHPELDSEEKINDRKILMEIHAHLCEDPLLYGKPIKSYSKEDVISAYYDFPIRRIHESMIGIRKDEDRQKTFRYTYIEGKEDQAYMAFRQVEALRALGLNNLEIGRIIAVDEYDHEKKHYKKMRYKIRELREERKMQPEGLDRMIERFRLEIVYKAIKARNIAKEILEKHQI